MANLSDILQDPNYVNANAATKKAIFDKYSATDSNYTEANAATQAAIRKKFGIEEIAQPSEAKSSEAEPDIAHNLKVAGSSLVENLPSAVGTALGTLGGGAFGSLATPVAGTIAGGIAGGVAGGKGAEKLADLATRYATGNPEATYRGYIQSKIGSQPTSEGERLARAMIETGMDVGAGLGVGSLAKGATKAAVRKAGELMVAQPLTQLAAGEAGTAGTELSDNQAVGFGTSLIPTAIAAAIGKRQFPKAAAAQTLNQINTAAHNAYEKAKNAGVVLTKQASTNLADSLKSVMTNLGFDEDAHDIIKPVVNMIKKRSDKELNLSQLDTFRRAINTRIKKALSAEGGADDARIGSAVVEELDNFISKLNPSQLSAGNEKIAIPALEEARKLWTQKSKMQTVQDILSTAERTGNSEDIEKGFTRIATNKNLFNKFSPDEQEIIGKIVKGDLVDLIAKSAPGVSPSGLSKGAIWALLGHFVAPGVGYAGAIGSGAVKLATIGRDKRQAEALSDLISRGYTPPKFSWSQTMAPSVGAGARGAMAPEEESDTYIDENGVPHITIRKAVGGLASLKKRYG